MDTICIRDPFLLTLAVAVAIRAEHPIRTHYLRQLSWVDGT